MPPKFNETIWLAHHSEKMKLWRLLQIEGSFILKCRVPLLCPTYISERRTTFAKAYGCWFTVAPCTYLTQASFGIGLGSEFRSFAQIPFYKSLANSIKQSTQQREGIKEQREMTQVQVKRTEPKVSHKEPPQQSCSRTLTIARSIFKRERDGKLCSTH
jgi:hypothetical protein